MLHKHQFLKWIISLGGLTTHVPEAAIAGFSLPRNLSMLAIGQRIMGPLINNYKIAATVHKTQCAGQAFNIADLILAYQTF